MLALSENKGSSVEVLIKSPNQQVDDLKIRCDLSWSVDRLKQHLSEVYPTKPLKNQQRIIFSGRLLPDSLLLREILTQEDGIYTMHLVCPHTTASSNPDVGAKTSTDSNKTENLNPGSSIPYASVVTSPLALNDEGLRQRIPQQPIPNVGSMFHSQSYPALGTTPGIPPHMAYQLAVMQQTYVQAMAQYFAQNNLGGMYGVPPVQTPPTSANQPQNNAPVAAQRPRNRENDENEFDLLDSMYVLTRVVMLLAVLYFYSSLGRILFVLTLALAFVTFRLTAHRRSQRMRQMNQPERRTNEQPPNNSEDGSDAGTRDSQEETQAAATPSESSPVQTAAPVPSALSVAVTFFKTFFTSLVPEQQPLTVQL